MRVPPEIDPMAVLASLGLRDVRAVTPVLGGSDAAIWRVDAGAATYALRVLRPEQAGRVQREAAAMAAAAAAGVPVPDVVATAIWGERPAMLLSWCDGRPLLHWLGGDPRRAWHLAAASGRLQARLHRAAAPASARAIMSSWIERLGPDEPALQMLLRHLPSRDDALLHLDYHPLNLMSDGRRLTGVLDWANCAIGDPRADLARTSLILRLHSPAARLLDLAWRRGYRQGGGYLRSMAPFYAWACVYALRDLAPRAGRSGDWATPRRMALLRAWLPAWKRRAGIVGRE